MQKVLSTILDQFRKILGLKPRKKPYLGYYYYEQLSNRYKSNTSYLNIYKLYKKKNACKTTVDIKVAKNFNTFDIHLKDAKAKYGKPYFILDKKEDGFKIKILLYRLYLGKYRAKLELHFYNNTLALFAYTLSHLSERETDDILSIFQEKYLNKEDCDFNKNCIVDKHQNVILVHREDDLSIKYLSSNSPLFSDLEKHYRQQKNRQDSQHKINRENIMKKI